jgi:hypothetical protein
MLHKPCRRRIWIGAPRAIAPSMQPPTATEPIVAKRGPARRHLPPSSRSRKSVRGHLPGASKLRQQAQTLPLGARCAIGPTGCKITPTNPMAVQGGNAGLLCARTLPRPVSSQSISPLLFVAIATRCQMHAKSILPHPDVNALLEGASRASAHSPPSDRKALGIPGIGKRTSSHLGAMKPCGVRPN